MNLLVVFPKVQYYVRKDTDSIRIMRNTFSTVLRSLSDAGVKFSVLAEDALMQVVFKDLDIWYDKVIRVLSDRDVDFVKKYLMDNEELSPMISIVNAATFVDTKADDHIKTPLITEYVTRGGLDAWLVDRTEAVFKHKRYAIDHLLEKQMAVLSFRSNTNMDSCTSIIEKSYMGDGKLYIEVDIESGMQTIRYGGVAIGLDDAKMILSL